MDVVGLDIVLQTAKTGTLARWTLTRGTLVRRTVPGRQRMQAVSSSLASSVDAKDRGSSDNKVSWGLVEISQAIIQRNYGIDSLMIQHQGIHISISSHTLLSLRLACIMSIINIIIFLNTVPHPGGGGGCLSLKDNSNADVTFNPLEIIFLPVNRQAVRGGGRGSRIGRDRGRQRITGVFNK